MTIKTLKKKYLDVGTGSGCIIISLCNNLKGNFTGIDVSKDALRVAISNNDRNETNVNFKCVDVLNYEEDFSVSKLNDKYDVIVSNPPYVLNSEKQQMKKNVLDWEPHIALFVVEASKGISKYEKSILKKLKPEIKKIWIFNKIDLLGEKATINQQKDDIKIYLSAKSGDGIPLLKKQIFAFL